MDPTQAFDPNRTMLNPGGFSDPNKTTAMSAVPSPMAPASPASGPALQARVVPGRTVTMANGPAREQFLIEFSAPSEIAPSGFAPQSARMPLNLCLVLDRSGSMEGLPLEYCKQACQHVVDMLTANDVLSIVTFEETVDVLMPPQRVTNKQPIKDGIARIQPGNTTNLYEGISQGLNQVLNSEGGRVTRLIVLSDGDPTAGIKDFASLVNLSGEAKAKGITCTYLGFGPDYNEELLASMAKKAGGNYYYIPEPQLIPEVFRTELEKLMTVVGKNLELELKLARWVNMRSPQSATGGTVTLPLADLERGSLIQQIVDLEFPNHPLGHYRVVAGSLAYDDMLTGRRERIDLDLALEFSADSARYSVPVATEVGQAHQVAQASRVVEKTIMGLKTGQITQMGAIAELQKTQMLLVGEGRTAEAQEVTMALRALQSGNQTGAEKTLMGTMVSLDQGKKSN
ncbi:MAG: VWA domain-containing protein [Armatimonadetes bacterium]|nr:VWA domain-containing protein [Armatimonadota bacterium]